MEPDRWIGWIGRIAAMAWLASLLGSVMLVSVGLPLPFEVDGTALALGALLTGLVVLALEAMGAGIGAMHDATVDDKGLLRRAGEPRLRATRPVRWN